MVYLIMYGNNDDLSGVELVETLDRVWYPGKEPASVIAVSGNRRAPRNLPRTRAEVKTLQIPCKESSVL